MTRVHNCLSIAEVGGRPLNSTRFISVPYITNIKELAEGDELIVQHFPRVATSAPKKRNEIGAMCTRLKSKRNKEAQTAVAAAKAREGLTAQFRNAIDLAGPSNLGTCIAFAQRKKKCCMN